MIIIYGSNLDATAHSHHAMQMVLPSKQSSCKLDDDYLQSLCIIDSKVEHRLQMSEGWIVLIEPNSDLGIELHAILHGQERKTFEAGFCVDWQDRVDGFSLLLPVFTQLNLSPQFLSLNHAKVKDQRIQQLLSELDQCFKGECIKPDTWRAVDVASRLGLSESRFLHLFSEQLGIAWRPFLLWRRMTCALQAMLNDHSATDAAYLAGFSDSAHLSRTFRNTFGMTIRQANALFR